jgi:hypothetical protein
MQSAAGHLLIVCGIVALLMLVALVRIDWISVVD